MLARQFLHKTTLLCAWTRDIPSVCGNRAPSITTLWLSPDSKPPFLGHIRRLLCLRYPRVVSSIWSQTFPPPLLCLFSGTPFPFLLPPSCEFMCGWFSWAQVPTQLQLCLLFVLTALRSASDTLWSAFPETGAPTELLYSQMEDSVHFAHTREGTAPSRMLWEPLCSVSTQ